MMSHASSLRSPLSFHMEKLLPVQYPLVSRFYKECGYRVKCGRLEQVYCLRDDSTSALLAAARFLPQEDYWILRNLCVESHHRGLGLARSLMQQIVKSSEWLVAGDCFCFALNYLQYFYQSLGFEILLPDQVPRAIGESYRRYSQHQPDLVLMKLSRRLNS